MKGRDLLGLSFCLVGILFVVAGFGSAFITWRFVSGSDVVPGTVVDYVRTQNSVAFMGGDEPTGVLYYPVVSYAVGSREYHVTGRRGTSRPVADTGSSIAVIVARDDPTRARLNTVLGVWGAAIILAALGGLFLLLSVAVPIGFGGSRGLGR